MAAKTDLRGLHRFMNRVEQYSNLTNRFYGAIERLCKEATKYAQDRYTEHGHSSIIVSYSNQGTSATIYATSKNKEHSPVAFFEFGTGEVGRGTYPDNTKLPQSGVPITGEWEYYYIRDGIDKKDTQNGEKGWWWGASFVKGQKAEAEMWRTSQYIQQNAKKIIADHFRSKGGG